MLLIETADTEGIKASGSTKSGMFCMADRNRAPTAALAGTRVGVCSQEHEDDEDMIRGRFSVNRQPLESDEVRVYFPRSEPEG